MDTRSDDSCQAAPRTLDPAGPAAAADPASAVRSEAEAEPLSSPWAREATGEGKIGDMRRGSMCRMSNAERCECKRVACCQCCRSRAAGRVMLPVVEPQRWQTNGKQGYPCMLPLSAPGFEIRAGVPPVTGSRGWSRDECRMELLQEPSRVALRGPSQPAPVLRERMCSPSRGAGCSRGEAFAGELSRRGVVGRLGV